MFKSFGPLASFGSRPLELQLARSCCRALPRWLQLKRLVETAGKIWRNSQGQHNFVHGHPMEIWVRRMHTFCGEGTRLNILGIDMDGYISRKHWTSMDFMNVYERIGLLLAECSVPSRQLFRRFESTVDLPFTFLRGCLEPGLVTYLLKVWNSHWHLNIAIALEHALFDSCLSCLMLSWCLLVSSECLYLHVLQTVSNRATICHQGLVREIFGQSRCGGAVPRSLSWSQGRTTTSISFGFASSFLASDSWNMVSCDKGQHGRHVLGERFYIDVSTWFYIPDRRNPFMQWIATPGSRRLCSVQMQPFWSGTFRNPSLRQARWWTSSD